MWIHLYSATTEFNPNFKYSFTYYLKWEKKKFKFHFALMFMPRMGSGVGWKINMRSKWRCCGILCRVKIYMQMCQKRRKNAKKLVDIHDKWSAIYQNCKGVHVMTSTRRRIRKEYHIVEGWVVDATVWSLIYHHFCLLTAVLKDVHVLREYLSASKINGLQLRK